MKYAAIHYPLWLTLLICWQLGERTLDAGLIWDAGGNGVAFFHEANWVDEVTGEDPPLGTVDETTKITFDLRIDFGIPGGNFETGSGVSSNIFLDSNRKLTINGGSLNLGNNISVIGAAGEDFGFSHLELNGGKMDTHLLEALKVELSGDAELIVRSPTTTVPRFSKFNFTSLNSSVFFANKTAANLSDEIAATTVFGLPAVVGQNLLITNQGSGALMQVGSPEPSSLLLTALGAGLLAVRLRRMRSTKERVGCL